jgi:hypothetical protein
MKSLFWFVSLAILSQQASAAPFQSCQSANGKYELRREIVPCGNRAELYIDGTKPQFGDLQCSQTTAAGEVACTSTSVVDAGYTAVFQAGNEVALSEIWIGGTRPLATLQCDRPLAALGCGPSTTVSAVVRDLNGLDGCGFVLELPGANGPTYLEPVNLPASFQADGAKVQVSYRTVSDLASICMVGDIVDITAIKAK